MAYKILISPRTQKEIENAIDYYSLYSNEAPINFITSLVEAYEILKENPFLELRYKNIRSFRLRRYPYSLYFTVDEQKKTIRVISCFHNKRDPDKRPNL